VEEYKKKNILYFRKLFGSENLNADDITYGVRIEDDGGKLMDSFELDK
jgi:hypothetical protein